MNILLRLAVYAFYIGVNIQRADTSEDIDLEIDTQ